MKDMSDMFRGAARFNRDVSKWDVSRVSNMDSMFENARSFNFDLSKWDVSSVTDMDYMFRYATLFTQDLCGVAWVRSQASKRLMFADSPGSISRTVCMVKLTFSPQSRTELKSAVDTCLAISPKGDCPGGPRGAIKGWDV